MFENLAMDLANDQMLVLSVTDLTLALSTHSKITYKAFNVFLQLPKALVRLTLHLPGPSDSDHLTSNAALWRILCAYKHSLEYLDLYREYHEDVSKSPLTPQRPHPLSTLTLRTVSTMGFMNDFEHLQIIRCHPEMLVGGRRASYQVREMLPESLHSLTLYGGQAMYERMNLEKHLKEVVSSGSFSKLRFLLLEANKRCRKSPRRTFEVLYGSPLQEWCKEQRIVFGKVSGEILPAGGLNRDCYEYTKDVEGVVAAEWEAETNTSF